jgi:putative heme-binding domain-containing protein
MYRPTLGRHRRPVIAEAFDRASRCSAMRHDGVLRGMNVRGSISILRRAGVIGLALGTLAASAGAQGPVAAPPSPSGERQWAMAELLPAMADLGMGREWMSGGRVFEQAGCGLCHAMSTYWGGNGLAPDLTAVASKMTRDMILQSILEPSATLNGQYYHTEFTLKDGTVVRGTVVDAVGDTLVVAPVMMVPDVTVRIAKTDIKSEAPSAVSPMPAGLLNPFSRDQVLDLIAFLDAGGNPDAAIYQRK